MDLVDPLLVLEGDRLAVHVLDECNNTCYYSLILNISTETFVFFFVFFFTPSFTSIGKLSELL